MPLTAKEARAMAEKTINKRSDSFECAIGYIYEEIFKASELGFTKILHIDRCEFLSIDASTQGKIIARLTMDGYEFTIHERYIVIDWSGA